MLRGWHGQHAVATKALLLLTRRLRTPSTVRLHCCLLLWTLQPADGAASGHNSRRQCGCVALGMGSSSVTRAQHAWSCGGCVCRHLARVWLSVV
jgi:hypothetical protein